jgi:hypothetical protein
MQDTRAFEELPLGGTRQPVRIELNQIEVPSQFLTGDDAEFLGAALVNGTGCTFVKAVSPYYIHSETTTGASGRGNFAY